jgi:hypothetical protein
MPVMDVSARAFTEGEKEMTMSDFITIEIKVKLANLEDNEFPGYVHSPKYPHLKKQGFWIIISDQMKDRTIIAHKLVFHSQKQTEIRLRDKELVAKEPLNEEIIEIRQQFRAVNKFQFIVTFMNDSYVGFDREIPLEFEVVQDDTTRVIDPYSKEDQDAIKAPSFFQAALQQQLQDDSSEEEDEDDSDEGEEKKKDTAGKAVNYIEDDFEKLKNKLKKAGLDKAAEKRDSQLVK